MESASGWENLGVVETIYEEEEDDDDSSSSTIARSLSSPPTPLHSRVKAWSTSTGCETDVVVKVQGSCFHLHKDPLASKSGYMKRQLADASVITLSPQLRITADTFTLVAHFCYGSNLFLTPFNIAALRTAAELLEMNGTSDGDSLRRKTEAYVCRTVTVNGDYAAIVLRSCLSLLPEAETAAALLSRCAEALCQWDDSGSDVMGVFEDVKILAPEDFQLVAKSLHERLTENHDLLYRIVDLYLKEHSGKMKEEQKSRVCNYIDCTILSPPLLAHAVQNPRMPLRFVVQAMFVEQLNTRRTLVSAAARDSRRDDGETLGAIIERDAALRQVAEMKSALKDTRSKIQCLEKELNSMRRIFSGAEGLRGALESGKSESFRLLPERKVERAQRGSVSSGGFRVVPRRDWSGGSSDGSSPPPMGERSLGRRLLNGLRGAFRVPGFSSKSRKPGRFAHGEDEKENGGVI